MTDDILDIPRQPSADENGPVDLVASEPEVAAPEPAVVPEPPAVETSYVDVTCPSCGTVSTVAELRRGAADFCRSCDYPLFWAIERATPPAQEVADSGVRRLPGTAGRAALAAFPCPQCNEPNPPSGVLCVRCGAELHPVAVVPEPEPEPVFVEPEPVVEEPQNRWWIWLIVFAVLLAIGGGVLAALLA